MNVGLVVDGVGEYKSLGGLFAQLHASSGNTFLRVVRADIQPYAPPGVIVRSCQKAVRALRDRGADRVVILFDREVHRTCASALAMSVERIYLDEQRVDVAVVVKDRCFENWLIADVDVFKRYPGRYKVSRGMRSLVAPDKADHVDAQKWLQRAVTSGNYEKGTDCIQILIGMDVLRAARNSRSLRRFLRVVGAAQYRGQSRLP